MKNQQYEIEKNNNPSFPKMEEKILKYWQKHNVFNKSVEQHSSNIAEKDNEFIFYDGPPFANGLPHYGHLLTGFMKDIIARFQTITGKKTDRRLGWDCHGLPAEMATEKELNIQGSIAIKEYGIDKFNDHCSKSVMKYAKEWEEYINRQARWVDIENGYKTMDLNYMESVLWAFKTLHQKGLLYEAYRVMPYSWAAETPLSNFETRLDNSYREKTSKAITVAFSLKDIAQKITDVIPLQTREKINNYKLLIWTTTPWTLPSNLAIAVANDVDYSLIIKNNDCYIIASDLVKKYQKELKNTDDNINYIENKYYIKSQNPERIFETKRLYAKKLSEADIELVQKLNSDQEVQKYLPHNDDVLRNMKHFNFLLNCYQRDGFGQWAIYEKNTDNFIGVAGPFAFNADRTEIALGYVIHQEFWGKGYATEITLANTEWAYDNLPIEIIYASTMPANTNSIRVMKKIGMKYDGEIDHVDYSKKLVSYKISKTEFKNNKHVLIKGKDLVGLHYYPLFPYFTDSKNAFQIVHGDFVTTEDGTGIVHMAPGFGEEDQLLCNIHNIETKCPVDAAGKFTNEIFDIKDKEANIFSLKSLHVFETNDLVIKYLKLENNWLKTEQYIHNYPHCWRTDKPLIYKAMSSWYVKVTEFKDKMVTLNKQVNWIPAHIKNGLFGKWIENARDWSISRNRFWGCPVPVWKSTDPNYPRIDVYGSIAELEKDFNTKIDNLHRPFIDQLKRPNPDDPTGKSEMVRVEDVLDCWFESGSMPYAQMHYPFENKEWFENHFPADFIVEYTAQTRGWFYTLFILGTALFNKAPFLNCVCHGTILDENSQKLSKRLKNYPDPFEMFNQYGADSMRWAMLSSPVMKGNELNVDKKGTFIKNAFRLSIKPIWNAYNFFSIYAKADNITIPNNVIQTIKENNNNLDNYILIKTKILITKLKQYMKDYNTVASYNLVNDFFEILNNWYIRRNRQRFWNSEYNQDKQNAYNTLYLVLYNISKSISPLIPFLSEEIYQGLNQWLEETPSLETNKTNNNIIQNNSLSNSLSVHLNNYPEINFIQTNQILIDNMDLVRDICNIALSIRNSNNLRIRLPLNKLIIRRKNIEQISNYTDIIQDELNVKNVEYTDHIGDLALLTLKLNFKELGKKYPEKIKNLIKATKESKWEKLSNNNIKIENIELTEKEYELKLIPKNHKSTLSLSTNDGLVELDLNLTDDLIKEGLARDFIRLIQQSRKDNDFEITDKIIIKFYTENHELLNAIQHYKDYIQEQTLAKELNHYIDIKTENNHHEFVINNEKIFLLLTQL